MVSSESQGQGWRGVILSASVMSLALMGDALLYIVLPVNAESFGLSFVWVGILLSANRIVRIFVYGQIAQLSARIGARYLTIIAAVGAVVSTLLYGIVSNGPLLLAARAIWGLSFAALVLTTLYYAATDVDHAGRRIGISRAIQHVGSIVVLTAGVYGATYFGPQEIFVVVAVATLPAMAFTFFLPKTSPNTPQARVKSRAHKPWMAPSQLDLFYFLIGLCASGIFMTTVTVLLAQTMSVNNAMLIGGLIALGPNLAVTLIGPLSGILADRFGARPILLMSGSLLALGFGLIALDIIVAGSIVIAVARGGLGVVGPTSIAQSSGGADLNRQASLQTWLDIGAATGPLIAGFLLGTIGHVVLYAAAAIALAGALCLLAWSFSHEQVSGTAAPVPPRD